MRKKPKLTTITISDLQKKIQKKKTSDKGRHEFLTQFAKKLHKDNNGYFKGKKVPFAKNQSFKQCIFNPYTDDGSFITVQVVGKFADAGSDINVETREDDLTRKMNFNQKNVKFIMVDKQKTDKELFELGANEVNLHKYGDIVPI